jgi:hypothetical protein
MDDVEELLIVRGQTTGVGGDTQKPWIAAGPVPVD